MKKYKCFIERENEREDFLICNTFLLHVYGHIGQNSGLNPLKRGHEFLNLDFSYHRDALH